MEPAHSLLTLLSTTQPPNNKESEFGATTASKPRRCRRRRRKKILQVCGGKLGIKASFSLFHKKSIIYKHLNTFCHIHGVLNQVHSVKIAICPPLEKLNDDPC